MTRQTLILLIGVPIVVLYAIVQFYQILGNEDGDGPETIPSGENAQAVPLHDKPWPVTPVSFTDEAGNPLDLGAWQGKVVLLNIWATWCLPCREEMPTLDRLQQRLGGKYFEVAALSIDRKGAEAVQKFYDQIGIKHLAIYVDQTMSASTRLGAFGIPTTLLLSPDGQELGRLVGPATWDSPQMIKFFETVITNQSRER